MHNDTTPPASLPNETNQKPPSKMTKRSNLFQCYITALVVTAALMIISSEIIIKRTHRSMEDDTKTRMIRNIRRQRRDMRHQFLKKKKKKRGWAKERWANDGHRQDQTGGEVRAVTSSLENIIDDALREDIADAAADAKDVDAQEGPLDLDQHEDEGIISSKEGDEPVDHYILDNPAMAMGEKDASPIDQENEKLDAQNTHERKEDTQALKSKEGDEIRYHTMFSTDCTTYQHWQSYILFYHFLKAKQPGTVTRILSGCSEEDAASIREWHEIHIQKPMGSNFKVHFAPGYEDILKEDKTKRKWYPYFNKPFGLRHWMEYGDHGMGYDKTLEKMKDEDAIVIILDPDMVLLRPITVDFSNPKENIFPSKQKPTKLKVEHGAPFAQKYGMGEKWMTFNLTYIAGPDSPASNLMEKEAAAYYPAGPPYIATARDMYNIARKWSEFVPRVHDVHPHLLAEMYAYIIAAAHLQLPHTLLQSLMISNPDVTEEGWPFVDIVPPEQICQFAAHPDPSKYPIPNVIHFCQRYALGEWVWGKGRFPEDYFTSCSNPLLAEPPADIALKYDYYIPPANYKHETPGPKTKYKNRKMVLREAYSLCGMLSAVNAASQFYKEQHCVGVEGVRFDKSMELSKVQK